MPAKKRSKPKAPKQRPTIAQRWEQGIPHNPRSIAIYRHIAKVDFELGDFFGFKAGGDGDNGEQLMYLLDDYFDALLVGEVKS